MPENSKLSVYNYVNEVYGNELTGELATRVHAGMENSDSNFQMQKAEMFEMLLSGKIRRGTLVYGYRFFRNNLFDNFFERIGADCFVDLSAMDKGKRREFFEEIVNQFIESQSDLLADRRFKEVLERELDYMWNVFEAAFSDLRIINITKITKRAVSDVVEE